MESDLLCVATESIEELRIELVAQLSAEFRGRKVPTAIARRRAGDQVPEVASQARDQFLRRRRRGCSVTAGSIANDYRANFAHDFEPVPGPMAYWRLR